MDHDRRTWLWSGLAIAGGVGLVTVLTRSSSGPAPAPARSRVAPGSRLLLVGDSLAQGLATPIQKLGQGAGVSTRTVGVSGSTVRDWSVEDGLAKVLGEFKPTVTLVSLGTNDMRGVFPKLEDEAKGLVALVRRSGSDLVWVSPPTMPFADTAGVRKVIAALGAAVYPSETLDIQRGPDKIHPTGLGYAGWAGAIWKWL